jgi:hypothetical protein
MIQWTLSGSALPPPVELVCKDTRLYITESTPELLVEILSRVGTKRALRGVCGAQVRESPPGAPFVDQWSDNDVSQPTTSLRTKPLYFNGDTPSMIL